MSNNESFFYIIDRFFFHKIWFTTVFWFSSTCYKRIRGKLDEQGDDVIVILFFKYLILILL